MVMRRNFLQYVWVRVYKIKVKHAFFAFIELYKYVRNICSNAKSFLVYLSDVYVVVGV